MVIFPVRDDKAPAVPKGTDWRNYQGEANTPMIGVMIPEGVFIIDLDAYKDGCVNHQDIDQAIGIKLDWETSVLQKTKNGGVHYAFCVPEGANLVNTKNFNGMKGLDTRSANKGYIATGNGYDCEHEGGVVGAFEVAEFLFPELPPQAIEFFSGANNDLESDDRDFLTIVANDMRVGLSGDEMSHYLNRLDDSFADTHWLQIGMAIYHETQGSEQGYVIFDEFSKRCPEKYDEPKNRKRWNSMRNDSNPNPITFKTVIKLAGGKDATKELVAKGIKTGIEGAETLDDIKQELKRIASTNLDNLTLDVTLKNVQAKYKAIMGDTPSIQAIRKEIKSLRGDTNDGDYVNDYVFLTATGEYCCRDTKAVMGPRAFDVKHNRETPLNSDGEKQSACMFSNDRIDTVENTMYFPMAGETFTHNGMEYLNSYKPSRVKPVKVGTTNIVERVKGHIAHLLPDPAEQNIVINYLAHNVQFPGKKLQWAIVLQGVQGDGKSFLSEMMKHVMGNDNVRLMNVQTLESAFTGWATGQCMTFIEELKLDNYRKYEVLNNLKPYISNPVVEETKKGKDPRTVINATNYFALTNFKDAIPIDANDRRYCVLFSQWQRKEALMKWMEANANYYHSIYEDMRENVGEILSWLLEHKISDEFLAMKRAPDTNAKNEMKELSKSQQVIDLEEAIDRFKSECTFDDNKIDVSHLQKLVKDAQAFGDFEDFPRATGLKNALINIGFELVGRKRTIFSEGDNKHTVYKF